MTAALTGALAALLEPIAELCIARGLPVGAVEDLLKAAFVEAARRDGCSWAQIGSVLGVSRQGAQQRYGGVLRRPWLRTRGRGGSEVARFGPDARRAVVAAQVAAWMHSPPHRQIMLDRRFREVGIGIVAGAPAGKSGGFTYVGEFGRRRC